jgi:hypothetical protein
LTTAAGTEKGRWFVDSLIHEYGNTTALRNLRASLDLTVVSNSTFDRGSLSPTDIKPFNVFAMGAKPVCTTGDWLAALDDFRNWLIREAA